MKQIAALFVQTNGCYYELSNVDPWDEQRDARLYSGPYPVIAHPPCARWGRYWSGGPSVKVKRKLGDDANCFATAFHCVKLWGGVLEHPAHSKAWEWFNIFVPDKDGWVKDPDNNGWVCHVEQGHYGHRARKATWLFARTKEKPQELIWGPSEARACLDAGYHSNDHRKTKSLEHIPRITKRECLATPKAFRDILIRIARGVTNV